MNWIDAQYVNERFFFLLKWKTNYPKMRYKNDFGYIATDAMIPIALYVTHRI